MSIDALIENGKKYFKVWSNNNIDELEELFSEDVTLQDWENFASGKKDVLEMNKKIFDGVDSIKANPVNLYTIKNKIFAELEILINNKEKIIVLDILSFDGHGKIKSIRAYKG